MAKSLVSGIILFTILVLASCEKKEECRECLAQIQDGSQYVISYRDSECFSGLNYKQRADDWEKDFRSTMEADGYNYFECTVRTD